MMERCSNAPNRCLEVELSYTLETSSKKAHCSLQWAFLDGTMGTDPRSSETHPDAVNAGGGLGAFHGVV